MMLTTDAQIKPPPPPLFITYCPSPPTAGWPKPITRQNIEGARPNAINLRDMFRTLVAVKGDRSSCTEELENLHGFDIFPQSLRVDHAIFSWQFFEAISNCCCQIVLGGFGISTKALPGPNCHHPSGVKRPSAFLQRATIHLRFDTGQNRTWFSS